MQMASQSQPQAQRQAAISRCMLLLAAVAAHPLAAGAVLAARLCSDQSRTLPVMHHHALAPLLITQVPGLLVEDRVFTVPLDHSGSVPGDIRLFVREVVSPANARRQQPYLLYLQGESAMMCVLRALSCLHCLSYVSLSLSFSLSFFLLLSPSRSAVASEAHGRHAALAAAAASATATTTLPCRRRPRL